jgi:hypothetical protein
MAQAEPSTMYLGLIMIKDWFSTGIALLSLTVSLSNAYFTTFQRNDDLRVILTHSVPIGVDVQNARFNIDGTQNMMFLNSGNRVAAITRVQLLLDQRAVQSGTETCADPQNFGRYDLKQPIIVKPAEMVAVELPVKVNTPLRIQKPTLPFSTENRAAKFVVIHACIRFSVVTPDSEVREKDIVAETLTVNRSPDPGDWDAQMETMTLRPVPLVQSRATVFDDWFSWLKAMFPNASSPAGP